MNIPNYEVLEKIHDSDKTSVFRALRKNDNQAVILKILKTDYPNAEQLIRYRQGYEITRILSGVEGVVKAYGIEQYQDTLMICLEDFGGQSLRVLQMQRTFSLAEALALAIQASQILGQIHAHNIIHKDINPANLLINPDTGELKIIDFGISTQFSKQHLALKNPQVLEGTLAYISPEQTGRMNRSLDYRTDFYSLGITFYELFTGKVPFEATDVLELVHCHIAKPPIPPHQINTQLPLAVSNIIMKIIEKTAESRYQSSWGIKADLEECQRQLTQTGQITHFNLGQQDISERFQVLQKLYGREQEISFLLAGFERVTVGHSEMMLIAGYSGVGKSALVKEIYQSLTEKRGYFISGKFDQFQRNIPYSALVNAFRELVQQLLTENEQQLSDWKQKLLSALGANGQIIIDIFPEIEQIIGQQPSVSQLGSTESQNRFNLVLQNFMRVFCQPQHPLVLFLDDLQWVDSASLKLLELLMVNPKNTSLYLIGAYRDNEVTPTHPLIATIDKLSSENVLISHITLNPLTFTHINQLIADSLHHSLDTVSTLTALVMRKTDGNPFFVNQFLQTLYEEELLTLTSPNTNLAEQNNPLSLSHWTWNIDQIEAINITDNVVDLMLGKLQKLPSSAQHIMRLAACIGNTFDLDTLSIIYEKSTLETFQALLPILNDGFILPSSSLELSHEEIQSSQLLIRHFVFSHDRVQQAAYALINAAQKQTMHLQIGRLLLNNTPEHELEDKVFDIIEHLNEGIELLANTAERFKVAELNLIAGKKAKMATAYAAANQYLSIGLALLPTSSWQDHYELTLTLYELAAEMAYLRGDFARFAQLETIILSQANSLLDKIKTHEIRIQVHLAHDQQSKAIEVALLVLQQFGVNFPTQPSSEDIETCLHTTRLAWVEKTIESLVNLPIMTDQNTQAIMRLLSSIATTAYEVAPDFLPFIASQQIQLSIKYGNTSDSAYGYAVYGVVLTNSGDIATGYQFGQLALTVLEKLHATTFKAKVSDAFGACIAHWQAHFQQALQVSREGYQSGLEVGDFGAGGNCAIQYGTIAFSSGRKLATLEREMASYLEVFRQFKQNNSIKYNEINRQAVLNLLGHTENPLYLIGAAYDEEHKLPIHQQMNDLLALYLLYFYKIFLSFLFQAYHDAIDYVAVAEEAYIVPNICMGSAPLIYLCDSLARLALYPHCPNTEQQLHLQKIQANQKKMRNWADHAPMNYLHKFYLVEAEIARVLAQNWQAAQYYEKAIAGAKKNQFLHEEAIAYELAAQFYLAQDMERVAKNYLKDAYYTYQQWGAIAKVRDLETQYPQFLSIKSANSITASTTISTTISTLTKSTSQWLDLNSIMKAAQTLSGEIVLSRLLEKMMRIVIENAGAEKGLLLLSQGEQWFIEAEGRIDCDAVSVLQASRVQEGVALPVSLVSYIVRTQESLVLNNASTDGLLVRDRYIKQHQIMSVLGLPLINQEQLIGILYLENNLTAGAFTTDRLETLNLLSAQIAISIQNAKLYAEIQTKERTLTQFLEAVPVGIGILNHTGQVHFINKTGQQWLGQDIVNINDTQSLSATYQLYLAETEEFYPDAQLPIVRALQGEHTHIDDLEIHHAERTIPVEAWGTPIYDQQGNILYAISTFLDISERRQAEINKLHLVQEQEAKNAALRYSAEIAAKNTELAATLQKLQQTQNQLVESEKMAALGNLVAGIAHEINTPVGIGVTAATQLDSLTLDFVKRYKDGKMARSDLEQYLNAVHHTSGLILKNLTRAAELTKSFKSVAVDQTSEEQRTFMLRNYIDEILTSLKPKLKHTHYQVSVDCDPNLQLTTYPGALAQIVTNLIMNSLQHGFIGRDQGHIHITAQHDAQYARLDYRDDGKGIAPEVINKIFEPFFTTDRAGGGSGLGMHIVYNLVTHKLNGSIRCESELGKGVCFTLTIPLSTAM